MQRGNKRASGLQRFYPLNMDWRSSRSLAAWALLWQVMQHGPSNATAARPSCGQLVLAQRRGSFRDQFVALGNCGQKMDRQAATDRPTARVGV